MTIHTFDPCARLLNVVCLNGLTPQPIPNHRRSRTSPDLILITFLKRQTPFCHHSKIKGETKIQSNEAGGSQSQQKNPPLLCLFALRFDITYNQHQFHIQLPAQQSTMFSAKSMTPIDRELSKKVVKIIHGLLMMEESAAFRKPVPHKALGLEDYKMIVKKPTDLNLIRRQNNEGKYKFVEEILDEIQLCWDNCKLYNALESDIYDQALYMEKAFDKFGIEILPDFWKDISREQYNQKFQERKNQEEKLKKPEVKPLVKKQTFPKFNQHSSEDIQNSKIKKSVINSRQNVELSNEKIEEKGAKKVYAKSEQHIGNSQQQMPIEQGQLERISMDIEEGEEGMSMAVEPILVNLNEGPSKQQLLELSNQVKALYQEGQYAILQKILEVLHSNEKEHMELNKNGLMSFKMSRIHISTYYRIKKILGTSEEIIPLIE